MEFGGMLERFEEPHFLSLFPRSVCLDALLL